MNLGVFMRIKKSDIRKANFSDASMLNFIIRQCFPDAGRQLEFPLEIHPEHTSNSTVEMVQKDLSEGISFFIKIDRGIPCGCIGLKQVSEEMCEVVRLGVLPGRRRRGFGSELLEALLIEAKELGATRVSTTLIGTDIELKQWFEKFGFMETETSDLKDFPSQAILMEVSI
jgi:N-acetylglutamate synthase-like GNAT family acetyltransferase